MNLLEASYFYNCFDELFQEIALAELSENVEANNIQENFYLENEVLSGYNNV